MNEQFGLRATDLEIIISILKREHAIEEAFIFGSRAKGNYKNGSDVDIALKGNLNFEIITHISYLLNEETPMPYKFDVLNYHALKHNDLIDHINRVGISFFKRSNVYKPN
ncbi:nucleotidyltransferase family protein [Parafilimonas sp.]|uniref:nucleotidyltransferase family protein n=1 Tax=Parafilimonas sp. TaxID=1969739 RepID=UPI0039E634D2